jgi:hypothetical protein
MNMLSVKGTYENGAVRLDSKIILRKKSKVIITFLEEDPESDETRLTASDFSFNTSREKTNRFKESISETIIDDRRIEG